MDVILATHFMEVHLQPVTEIRRGELLQHVYVSDDDQRNILKLFLPFSFDFSLVVFCHIIILCRLVIK